MDRRIWTVLGVVGLAATVATAQQQGGVLTGRPPEGMQNTAPTADPDAPRIQFESVAHNFGKISDEKPVEVEFKFTNTGKKPLLFTSQPTAGCGCTVPQLSKMEYAPGEAGSIKVVFNPSGKHGEQNQRVTIRTNDPSQPEMNLLVQALVRQKVWFDPPLVSFGELQVGVPAKQTVRVYGPAPEFKVTYVSSTRGRFFDINVLSTNEVERDGEKVNESIVEIAFNGKAPRGTIQAMGTARTTIPSHSLADFQIMAEVVGDLMVMPPRLNIGLVDGGSEFNRPARVSSRVNRPFKITKIDQQTNLPKPLDIKIVPREGSNGAEYNLDIRGTAPEGSTPLTGTLTIHTDSPVDPVMTLVINGASRPRSAAPTPIDPIQPPAAQPATQPAAQPAGQPPAGQPR